MGDVGSAAKLLPVSTAPSSPAPTSRTVTLGAPRPVADVMTNNVPVPQGDNQPAQCHEFLSSLASTAQPERSNESSRSPNALREHRGFRPVGAQNSAGAQAA